MNTTAYPELRHAAITEICDMFDLTVLADVVEKPNQRTPMPKMQQIYALGQHSELAAGLVGGTATGWFDSLYDLNLFCSRNLERARVIAADQNETNNYEWVDMTEWK